MVSRSVPESGIRVTAPPSQVGGTVNDEITGSDESSLDGLHTLVGWWWYMCLFFDDCRHQKLISLTRELASPKVSLPYSARYVPVLLPIEELLGVRKRPQIPIKEQQIAFWICV
jgi:hypothetical protein